MCIDLSNRRECFFDNYLLDTAKTSCSIKLHHPVPAEIVMTFDEAWEGDGCDYFAMIFDPNWRGVQNTFGNGCYRMYYLGWQMFNQEGQHDTHGITVCYAESPDGKHWVKPKFDIFPQADGSLTNILLDKTVQEYDNFMVFIDENPNCPPSEKYKGIAAGPGGLGCYVSADGIHFIPPHENDTRPLHEIGRKYIITDTGDFDSLNVCFWDKRCKKYRAYFRTHYYVPEDQGNDVPQRSDRHVRAISYRESDDFIHWTENRPLTYDDGIDMPLYTNNVIPYYRADHLYIGTPTRYIERQAWTPTFDRLCGKEKREYRYNLDKRYGLTITDCAFMVSRNGVDFHRYKEAFMQPEIENGRNWTYGDCYPSYGYAVTASETPGAPDELSVYLPINHWMQIPAKLQRYTLRIDGFASLHADWDEQVAVTKPFRFEGNQLEINFRTTAAGYMFIQLETTDGQQIESYEIFGNTIDRIVDFTNGNVADFSGKEVVMTVRFREADFYAFRFFTASPDESLSGTMIE